MTQRIIDFDDGFESTTAPVPAAGAGVWGGITGTLSDQTDLQTALGDIETKADDAQADATQALSDSAAASGSISAHISDATDAHDASSISNIPSGNLAATDQQGVNNELQTDIDSRATSSALTAHTGAGSGAHAATAISNTPAGNLAATDVQAALNELQTDVDTRISNTLIAAKGDLISATANDTPAILSVGTNGYALVADSAEATGLKWVTTSFTAPNSSVIFNTGVTSNGSTNTTVRRFANVSTAGTALTATQSTTNGDSVTVNEAGAYTISFTDVATAINSNYAAITINGSALTTDPSAITFAQGFRAGSYNPSDEMWFVGSTTLILAVNDVVRFQRTNARLSSSSRVIGIVTQVTK